MLRTLSSRPRALTAISSKKQNTLIFSDLSLNETPTAIKHPPTYGSLGASPLAVYVVLVDQNLMLKFHRTNFENKLTYL